MSATDNGVTYAMRSSTKEGRASNGRKGTNSLNPTSKSWRLSSALSAESVSTSIKVVITWNVRIALRIFAGNAWLSLKPRRIVTVIFTNSAERRDALKLKMKLGDLYSLELINYPAMLPR